MQGPPVRGYSEPGGSKNAQKGKYGRLSAPMICLEVTAVDEQQRDQLRNEYFAEAEKRGLFPVDMDSCPADANISVKRAATLFWWWSIEKDFKYPKLGWRDNLTPEEQAYVEKLDATKQEDSE